MAHARKESVSTAAALFGDTSGDTDFFSSLQDPQSIDTQHTYPTDHDRQFSQPAHNLTTQPASQDDAAGLFASTDATSALDGVWDQSQTSYDATAQHHPQTTTDGNYDYGSQDAIGTAEDPYANQGWYDEHGRWHDYADYQDQPQEWAQDTTYASAGQDASYNQPYDENYAYSNYHANTYAAPTNSTYAPPATTDAYAPASTYDVQHTYDPYQPVTHSYEPTQPQTKVPPTSSYAPVPATYTSATPSSRGAQSSAVAYASQAQQAYDPYKPTASSYAPPPANVAAPPISTPYSAYSATQQVGTPKATQHAADVYKATSYNAYDPPILDRPRKTTKTQTLAAGILSPPPATGSAYGFPASAYGQTAPAPATLPPPPPKSPYYGQAPPVKQQLPPPPAPPKAAKAVNGSASAYNSYAPTQATPYSAPNDPYRTNPSAAYQATSDPYQAQPYSQPVASDWTPRGENGSQAPLGQNGHHDVGYQNGYGQPEATSHGGYAPENPNSHPYDPYGAEGAGEFNLGDEGQDLNAGYGGVSGSIPPLVAPSMVSAETSPTTRPGPPRSNSITSTTSYGNAVRAVYTPPPTSKAVVSPPSSVKGPTSPNSTRDHAAARTSPPTRYQSPPSKTSPSRSTTPGSVRSHVTSPDNLARVTMSGARASPRPESYQSNSSGASNPAAHLEKARGKIVSPPDLGAALHLPHVKPNGTTGAYDPYRPHQGQRSASMPIAADPIKQTGFGFTPLDPVIPRVGSPYAIDHSEAAVPVSESYDPYAPQGNAPRRQASEPVDHTGGEYFGGSTAPAVYGTPYTPEPAYSARQSMESTHSAYTPSTTQTGGDDFLGRRASRNPIICFGFGGKVVSCFHSTTDSTAGFDVSMISRKPPPVFVRPLKDIVPEWQAVTFPGPLFCDPGTPTVNITKTASATLKAKKAQVIKYLEERATVVEEGLNHLPPLERSKGSGKLCLLQLLKTMVENDGKLSGSPEIEKTVRHILVPRLKATADDATAYGFTTPAAGTLGLPIGVSAYGSDAPLATYEVRPTMLDKIQEYLLKGERRMAYRHALDEKLWAHAMLIASSVDKEAWKEAVNEFVRTELGADAPEASSVGREPLRMAYSLFAGQGYAAVEGLLPPRSLARSRSSTNSLLIPASPIPPSTPVLGHSAAFTTFTQDVPIETLNKWQETAATVVANVSNGDIVALTGLGDMLMANKWAEAAHVCYMLSLKTSLLGGIGSPSAKVVLVGSESPQTQLSFHVDSDPLIFSEVLEFALSLTPVAKGQEPFSGIPHLQAYRLLHAFQLAETGHINLATRYCDAIGTSLRMSKPSPYYTGAFQEQLKELTDRLSGTPQLDKTGSWIARKMTKPSLATLGSWIESGVTNFIAGSGEESAASPVQAETKKKEAANPTAGPFAQYTVITSANTSPNASSANLSSGAFASSGLTMSGLAPPSQTMPRRSGSALALRGPYNSSSAPTDRSASAMDMRPDPRSAYSAGPQIFSANAATTSFYQSQSMYSMTSDGPDGTSTDSTGTERPLGNNWWDGGSTTTPEDSNKATPTTTTFYSADDQGSFTSPMDSVGHSRPPSYHGTPRSGSVAPVEEVDEDVEDLGFGNNASKKKRPEPLKDQAEVEKEKKAAPGPASAKPPATPAPTEKPPPTPSSAAGSWLPWKWGKKEDGGPGPIKAKLGEESAFYYDKELKKWVNKKAAEDPSAAPAALPPPPPSRAPSRAQTASPGASAPLAMSRGVTPPPRPQSSSATAGAASKAPVPPRRSHLAESFVPTSEPTSSPPTPGPPSSTGNSAAAASRAFDPDLVPPPSRTGSSTAKRKGKSRYVDVFQQQSQAS